MMSTTTPAITDPFSAPDFSGVQLWLLALPGVGAVTMTAAASNVPVIHDEDGTDAATLARGIAACGLQRRGEGVPTHVCLPDSTMVPPNHPAARAAAVRQLTRGVAHAGMTRATLADQPPADTRATAI